MYIQKTTKCKVAQSISKSTKNENTQKVQLSSKSRYESKSENTQSHCPPKQSMEKS